MKSQVSNESNSNITVTKDLDELKAVCGLNCADCRFYEDQCLGCRKQKGRMFWGLCPIYYCCVYEKGMKFCANCSEFLCQRYLDQITTSIGL